MDCARPPPASSSLLLALNGVGGSSDDEQTDALARVRAPAQSAGRPAQSAAHNRVREQVHGARGGKNGKDANTYWL